MQLIRFWMRRNSVLSGQLQNQLNPRSIRGDGWGMLKYKLITLIKLARREIIHQRWSEMRVVRQKHLEG